MLQLNELSIRRGNETLIEGASVKLAPHWKVGLCGANGCGKSSLFAFLLGQLDSDLGEMLLPNGWRLVHMEQHISDEFLRMPIIDYVMAARERTFQIRQLLNNQDALNDNQIAELNSEFENLDGYRLESEASIILSGLGFKQDDFDKPVDEFSGGWQMRLNLSRALLQPSDCLLLDEPTNHLDIDAIIWLENFLAAYQGLLVVISHDRNFLDKCVDHIAMIHSKKLELYQGNYSQFERLFAEQQTRAAALNSRLEKQREHMQSFIDRFKAKASKAKQAQSRVKALAKLPEIAALQGPDSKTFHLPDALDLSPPLLHIENLQTGYPDYPLTFIDRWTINPNDCIGLLGANGAGKSTLIKTLLGEIPAQSGIIEKNKKLVIGYFSQNIFAAGEEQLSPLALIQKDAPEKSQQQCRDFLGSWYFTGDLQDMQAEDLSGGQQARLALARIALHKPAILFLDEPTNHLDIASREALTMALQGFDGAVILISHDRHLLEASCDEFLRINNGKLERFAGDLSDYQKALIEEQRANAKSKAGNSSAPVVDKKLARQQAAAKRAALAPLQKKIKQHEKKIDNLNKTLEGIEAELGDQSLYLDENKERLAQFVKQQGDTKKQIENLEEIYLEMLEELEEASS